MSGANNPAKPNRKDYPPFRGKPIPNRWVWSEDNGEPFCKCPKCDCGMNPYDYSHAVGTRGWSFCPYCGEDLRKVELDEPRQLTIMDFLGKEDT